MNDRSHQTATVAVIGGGLSGLSASCALAQSGAKVTLFERRPYLGGRASSYQHPATGEIIDNCQHVLFGSCTNLIEFYRRIGVDDKIRWSDQMTFIEPGGRRSRLRPSFLPAPLHTAPSFWNFAFLSFLDKLRISEAMASLLPSVLPDDGDSFLGWLQKHGQSEPAIARFWNPILVSALSEDLDRISVSSAAQVVRESMKSVAAGRMGIPMIPLTDLYAAAERYISERAGEVRLRCGVQSIQPEGSGVVLQLADSTRRFDSVILAVPYFALAPLLPEDEAARSLRDQIAHFESSSITGIHLWFDRNITDLPHAVLLDRTIQWMFHKSQLQERDSQGSYIELVVSSSKELVEKTRQEIIDLALGEVREFFPEARAANLVKSTVIKEVNAAHSPRPGIDRYRPSPDTAWPRVFLAGDWTATGWPATMEGAVRSGYAAAEAVLGEGKFQVPDLAAGGLMRLWG